MDWNIRRRVCSARKGQKRVESLGVCVSDLRPSVMRTDLGKARHINLNFLDEDNAKLPRLPQAVKDWSSQTVPELSTLEAVDQWHNVLVVVQAKRDYDNII